MTELLRGLVVRTELGFKAAHLTKRYTANLEETIPQGGVAKKILCVKLGKSSINRLLNLIGRLCFILKTLVSYGLVWISGNKTKCYDMLVLQLSGAVKN